MATGLENVFSALLSGANNTAALQGQLGTANRDLKAGIVQASEATQQGIANQGIIDVQKARGELEAQDNTRRAASSIGTNMSDLSQIVTEVGDAMRTSGQAVISQAKKVQEIESRSDLFSNPLGFVYDLLYGDAERAKLEGAASTFDAATKVMQSLNQATQQTAVTQNALAQTKTDATVAAEAELAQNKAALAAAEAKQKLAGADMQYINMADSLNARQTSLAIQAHTIKQADERQAWMRAAQEEKNASDSVALQMWNTAAPSFNSPTFKTLKEFNAFKTTMPKGKVDYIMSRGAEMYQAGGDAGAARIASNPYEALTVVKTFGVPLNEAQKSVAVKFNSMQTEALSQQNVVSMLMNQFKMPRDQAGRVALEMIADKKQHPELIKSYMEAQAQQQLEMIRPGDASNIYSVPSLDFLATKTEMDNNPFLSKYIKPMAAAGGAAFDPSTFFASAGNAVKEGISVDTIAEGITYMAQQAALYNNATINYPRTFGVAPMTKVVMPVKIDDGSLFFSDSVKAVDLLNPTQVRARILDAASAGAASKSFNSLQQSVIQSMQRQQVPTTE